MYLTPRDAETAPDKWKTWWIIFCLIFGLVLVAAFVFVESRVASPLMPLSIWRIPQFGKLMLCFGLGFGAFLGSIILGYSLYFQQIYGASPITVHPSASCANSDYTIFYSATPLGVDDEFCCGFYSPSCARGYIIGYWHVVLCDCHHSWSTAAT
jgi:hypothetical protein